MYLRESLLQDQLGSGDGVQDCEAAPSVSMVAEGLNKELFGRCQ
jgi:hypothetical protein